jgi:signal transduction histidine kinase
MSMASATSSSSARHTSLRLRVALALALLSVLGIFTMALALVMALDQSQEEFIDNELANQIAYSMKIWRDSPSAAFPNTPDMQLYRLGADETASASSATVPAALARLPVGNHEIIVDGREHHVAVREDNSGRYILAYNVEATEDRERAMLASVVIASLVIGLVALVAGYLLAGRLTRQLDQLAGAVEGNAPGKLSDPKLDRELLAVARALDGYRERQQALLEHERAFAANLSHEIRTPLTAIRTDAELLAALPGLPDAAARRGNRIIDGVDRINRLASSLLLLARDACPANTEEVRLLPAIESVWTALEADAATPGPIRIEVDPQATLNADPALVDLVLRNVLDNARRFSERGTCTCHLDGQRLVITDSGPGFAPDELPRVFERFFIGRRGENGLGLALVRHVCDACGWDVSARNTADGHGRVVIDFGGQVRIT